jgi:GGDEF domain-containing protein
VIAAQVFACDADQRDVGSSVPERFTDPLSAVMPRRRRARARACDSPARCSSAPRDPRWRRSVSFGVSEVHCGAGTARAMLDDADRAMYAAKRAGRDRVMRSDELPAIA